MALSPYDDTNYPGIMIDDGGGPTFHLTVREALGLLITKPIGRDLLSGICNSPAPGFGPWSNAKVKLMRGTGTHVPDAGASGPEGGSVAIAVGATQNAFEDGVGCPAAVKWNPNIFVTPSGSRRPFIGLAHELIHALHYTTGTRLRGGDEPGNEEFQTVGLGQYEGSAITERKIRAAFGIADRTQY